MIVVDTSALIAILLNEPERDSFRTSIGMNDTVISALNLYETSIVVTARRGEEGRALLEAFVRENAIHLLPFDETQARLAAAAYARYGKGLGSKASLNLCDCAAYALATSLDAPLLFKGEDFSQTDVRRCV